MQAGNYCRSPAQVPGAYGPPGLGQTEPEARDLINI